MRNRRTYFVVSALGLGTSNLALAQADIATIAVDATSPGAAIDRIWAYHGYDEVNYTTTEAGRELLAKLSEIHTATPRVRTHFLLNTGDGVPGLKWGSTNVYSEDADGKPRYDWTLMDGILDALTNAGAVPLLEVGFMPQALTGAPASLPYRNLDPFLLTGACFYPPKDYAKWGQLVFTWAAHVADRYGEAVKTWPWELWNEPDLGYWHANAGLAEYAKLYDFTEAALHQMLPEAQLGGPAVIGVDSSFFTEFLEHCVGRGPSPKNAVSGANSTRIDFVSFHAKGGVAMSEGHVVLDLGNQLRLHRLGFDTIAQFPELRAKPIVISEADPDGCAACKLGNSPEETYRNSPAYAAYVVAMMKRTMELGARSSVNLAGIVTWAFTFDPNDPSYFPGYRALAAQGIHLPVMNAFKLLGPLNGNQLPVTSSGALPLDAILADGVRGGADLDALATLDGDRIQILVWNYHDALIDAPPTRVRLATRVPLTFGAYAQINRVLADGAHGDAYAVWSAQGRPATPTAAQIAELRAGMEAATITSGQTVSVKDGTVNLEFNLARFGISLVTLTPANGNTVRDTGTALHQARDAGCACRLAYPRRSGIAGVAVVFGLLGRGRRRRRVHLAASFASPSFGWCGVITAGHGSR